MKAKRAALGAAEAAAAALFIYFLINPERASAPAREALTFCAGTLIPSLFVCMVLARAIMSFPAVEKIASKAGAAPVIYLLGLLCGSPVGADAAAALYRRRSVSKEYAEYLCSFSNGVSAPFLAGAVGGGIIGERGFGLRLIAYQAVASAAAALIMKRVMFGVAKLPRPAFGGGRSDLRGAIVDSAAAMLNICACAVFFITVSGAIARITRLGAVGEALLRSVFEFSSGCAAAGAAGGRAAKMICAFACGGTGLSVMLQVKSVTGGELSLKPYAAGKLINCAVMTALTFFIG